MGSFRRFRSDAALWVAAAGLTLAGVALALNVALRPSVTLLASAPSVPPQISRATEPPFRGAAPSLDAASRASAFQLRLARFAPLEAGFWRAFLPPAAPASHRAAGPRLVRLAAGATPQACLAQAVYYEARGEPREGQAAVAQVVLNRVRSGAHPGSVCGVVFEGASRPGCQFSFACDPRLAHGRVDAAAWRRAQGVAARAMDGAGAPELRAALNYHADSVHPRWADGLQRAAEIGRHIFYAAAAPAMRGLAPWTSAAPPEPHAAAD